MNKCAQKSTVNVLSGFSKTTSSRD